MKRMLVALPVVLLLGLVAPPAMADPIPPTMSQLSSSFRPTLGFDTIPVKITWSGTSPYSICKYELWKSVQRPDGSVIGSYKTIPLQTPTSTTAIVWERAGYTYSFHLDVYDCADNAWLWLRSLTNHTDGQQESAATLDGASWTSQAQASASGGSVARATADGDSADFFLCRSGQFGVFMNKGPNEGLIDIYIDGTLWKSTLSLNSPTLQPRHLIYQHRFPRTRFDYSHEVKIVKSGGSQIDLDAVASLSQTRC